MATYSPYYPNYPMQYPQMTPQNPPQNNIYHPAQTNGIIWIQGENAARSYLVAPNQNVLLLDSEVPRMYMKSADATGMPTLKIFEYKEIKKDAPIAGETTSTEYITRDEFEKRLKELKTCKCHDNKPMNDKSNKGGQRNA